MTASAVSRSLYALLFAVLLAGCNLPKTAPAYLGEPLEPLSIVPTQVPGPEDFAAARLAAAALASNRAEIEISLDALERVDAVQQRRKADDDSDMLPLALDLVNATLDDPADYRLASQELIKSEDEDRALRARLESYVDDDPLEIARKRVTDSYQKIFARTFNAISEPLGRSMLMGASIAPLTIASTVVHWLAMLYSQDPLSLQGRQALVQRERFLREYPNSPLVTDIRKKMKGPTRRRAKTYRNKFVRGAKSALGMGNARLAQAFSIRALFHMPEDKKALAIHEESLSAIEDQRALRWASTRASEDPLPELAPEFYDPALELAHALLLPGDDVYTAAQALLQLDPEGVLADEAAYALALAEFERGWESRSWERLTGLANGDADHSNMLRHAEKLVFDPWNNVYGAFERRKTMQRGRRASWKLLGPWAARPRYDRLPAPIAYLIDSPAVAQTLITSPIRLAMSTVKSDKNFQKPTSLLAYRYLERYPDGEHEPEMIRWLFDYEEKMQNYSGALRLADFISEFDPDERMVLAEQAAAQQLNSANKARRRDMRGSVLRNVAREYPDSEAGHAAGSQAREEATGATAQHIRMTREFLWENPRIAGPEGLGLRAALRDEDAVNGELHPAGVTFLGGREIEFAFLAESADEDDPPVLMRRKVSEERLARVVALVEETVLHNSQVDPDDRMGMDARRDYYFERARLGLTDVPDTRATAESTYVYRGMRERYGMVRARDGILPFDLVVQGSISDFSIGAFPRLREPKETPDAFLYR